MGTMERSGHGCYPAQIKGGQSLLVLSTAALMPAQRASPSRAARRLLRPVVPGRDGLSAHPP